MRGWSWISNNITSAFGFGIIQPITGTSPTASVQNDTLTLISSDSSISILGNAGAKSIDLVANLTAYIPYVGATADLNLGNTQKVINCQDPVNAQDVATKNYIDTNIFNNSADTQVIFNNGGQLWGVTGFEYDKINDYLKVGNLSDGSNNPVMVVYQRQLVTPDGTVIFDWSANDVPTFKAYGTTSGFFFEGGSTPYLMYNTTGDVMSTGNFTRFIFNNSYVQLQLLEDSSSVTSVYVQARTLHDSAGTKAMEWTSTYRQLFDFGGIYPSVDFGNYGLWNIGITNSVPLLDWSTSANGSVKIYYGYNNAVVGDFTNCQLNDTNNSLRLDWLNMYCYDNTGQVSVDWNYHTLLYMGVVVANWQNLQLIDSSSVVSHDWGTRVLSDSSALTSVSYGARQLLNSSGNALGDWSGNAFQINGSTGANNGSIWTDVTRKAFQFIQGTATQTMMGIIFSQTATGTVANTVTEGNITSTGSGTLTLPADFLTVGKTIRLMGKGIHSGTASPNLTIRVKFGSTTILTTGAVATGNATNEEFEISAMITCRSTGVSGTIFAQGDYIENASTPRSFGMVNTTTTTVNTTTTHAITVTAQWSAASASNTISLTNFVVEVI